GQFGPPVAPLRLLLPHVGQQLPLVRRRRVGQPHVGLRQLVEQFERRGGQFGVRRQPVGGRRGREGEQGDPGGQQQAERGEGGTGGGHGCDSLRGVPSRPERPPVRAGG